MTGLDLAKKLSETEPYQQCSNLVSGVAKPGPTRALARASAHLALASEIDDDHMINLYSLQSLPSASVAHHQYFNLSRELYIVQNYRLAVNGWS